MSDKNGPLNHRKSIQRLYSPGILSKIAQKAAETAGSPDGDLTFSSFQRDILQEVFPGFHYDFCATSIVSVEKGTNEPNVQSICFGLPDEAVENYVRFAHQDDMSPVVYRNPGRAIKYTQVVAEEKAETHPFYINHLSKYGIRYGTSICFNYPGHQQTFIAFDYLAGKQNKIWHFFEHHRLELASFPFAQAYLMRCGMIDELELQRQFTILKTLSEAKLANLRKYVNSPHEDLKYAAAALGIKYGTLHDDLRDSRRGILERLRKNSHFASDAKDGPLRILHDHCQFLRALRDHTEAIKFPDN